ncbi:unnamed protein product [Bursaphelenchus okinawaensis]|uniref:Uncharacterized protein n=1 Tax=Bursaphelenchus okinawaensis TaxID=465554 RepID=A0A811KC13_9BILA|nr:unnamed protein product [Bursaphelenchus okinawaensis]CAG9098207.1 unnamed protein product [Bursaphelenchus okinawaensis]
MLGMVLLVLLCLVPCASCDNYCYHCEETENGEVDQNCMVIDPLKQNPYKVCRDSCYTIWGNVTIGDKVVLAVQRDCDYQGQLPNIWNVVHMQRSKMQHVESISAYHHKYFDYDHYYQYYHYYHYDHYYHYNYYYHYYHYVHYYHYHHNY